MLVRDDRQRLGIGSRLIDEVVHIARARGAGALAADLRPDRRFLLAVLGRHGCVVARTDADGIHAEVALPARSAPTEQLTGQCLDARADLVAHTAHDLDGLPGRVGELPVLVALAGEVRAGVPAAHGDHHVRT